MNPVTNEQAFLQYQINKLIEQQEKTNQLLHSLVTALSPAKEEVEPLKVEVEAPKAKRTKSTKG